MKSVPLVSVVDDDQSMREATRRLIRSIGLQVETFDSAEAFLESQLAGDTACLISDVQMPGMSGVELQDVLTKNGYSTPIIFITAFPEDSIKDRVLNAGAVGFLPKPFMDEMLIDHLNAALKQSGWSAISP